MSDQNITTTDTSLKNPISTNKSFNISKARAAQLAILFYFLLALLSPLGLLVPPEWIDEGDAAATVEDIQDNETLFRIAIVMNLFGQISFLLAGIAFYELFKDVDRFQAKLLLAFVALSVPMTMVLDVFRFGALHLIGDADYLASLEDRNAQVVFMMTMHGLGIHIVELFWGLWLLPLGYLFYKSEYIPKILGFLLIVNGVSYVLDVFNWMVFSQENEFVTDLLFLGETIGELPTILWLVIMGIRLPEKRVHLWG
ncbi:MAG: DUF4386 domain-containing protein [Candidatus Kariarchaeaceae archaeon]|jgi:hypothetical protein